MNRSKYLGSPYCVRCQSSVEEFFARLAQEGEVEKMLRQIGGPEGTQIADIIAGVKVRSCGFLRKVRASYATHLHVQVTKEGPSSLSCQIDDDGVTHEQKRKAADEQRQRMSNPVHMWIALRDEWEGM